MNFDKSQIEAIDRAVSGRNCIITGGAGTGKTTIIKEMAKEMDGGVTLLCPTGKAAARVKEATGFYCETIHRALGWDGTRFLNDFPINTPVIVDESSMIDSWLMARLLERCTKHVTLVGDASQLPPVGHGQPFHDLLRLRPDMTTTLSTCYRSQEAVHKAATAIREGRAPAMQDITANETWKMIETGNAEQTTARIVEWTRAGMLDFSQDIVLSPRYGNEEENDGGIDALNRAIIQVVNPHEPNQKWKAGDRVICCKNFSKIDMWNGDTGSITDIDHKGIPFVKLDRNDADIHLEHEHEKELRHAYALSIHKAQGSQFRRVVFVCLRRHFQMLSRPLIYTAVTRAKSGCVVVGDISTFLAGINQVENRETVLQYIGGLNADL